MFYLPILCDSCLRVALSQAVDVDAGRLTCASCGAQARVVPGCNYSASEVAYFQELSQIVAAARVSRIEAQGMALDIERNLRGSGSGALFERLAGRLAGLMPVQMVVGKNVAAQRRALLIIRTILDAIALSRHPTPPAAPGNSLTAGGRD